MKARFVVAAIVSSMLSMSWATAQAQAQTKPQPSAPDDLPKYELGVDFTTLSLCCYDTRPGAGGRFTYNWNRRVALEAAGYFIPENNQSGLITGSISQGLFGVKAGQRFQKWGIFGKARPGVISLSKGFFDIVPNGNGTAFPFDIIVHRQTNFALDLGGVIEVYPTKKLVLRFDGGVLFNRYPSQLHHSGFVDPSTGLFVPETFTSPGFTQRYFQFIGGVGFRF
jgi:hypothetical protein